MSDLLGLSGKTAIVWGGGQGMGEASAVRLAEAGCDVAVVDVVKERAEVVADIIRGMGRKAVALGADATREDEVERAVAEAESALAPIDVMITVIGMSGWISLLEMPLAEWDRIVDLNLKHFFLTARAVARSMHAGNRQGAIVAVASVSGLTAAPMHAHYGAAKAGLVNLVRSMAAEWSPLIRVNAVAPGTIKTARVLATPEREEMHREKVPMARMGVPDEIGKAALFLASDLASYMTGQTIAVDGGWTATFLMHSRGNVAAQTLNENAAYRRD